MTDRGRIGDPWRALLVGACACAVLAAAGVLIVNAMRTSSARVAASTTSDGLLSTATISLDQPGVAAELLLDADGLYPGVEVTGCVVVEYTGSIPVNLRLHGAQSPESGLDPYLDVRLATIDATACPVDQEVPADAGTAVWTGRLDAFWRRHSSYARGIELDSTMVSGDRVVVAATAVVADDNRAQGQITDFTLAIEARPA